MTESARPPFSQAQLAVLRSVLHEGSLDASRGLADWIGKPSVIEIDALEQLSLAEATGWLTTAGHPQGEPICFCVATMSGVLTGQLILAFDDDNGLALAGLLLDDRVSGQQEWTEMAVSAALETANILCCAYLNSLWKQMAATGGSGGLLPSPPAFHRDYAESVLQFALMSQAMQRDHVILAKTRFEIDDAALHWTLLFVPDALTMTRLPDLLTGGQTAGEGV